jgi:hypothetical protein
MTQFLFHRHQCWFYDLVAHLTFYIVEGLWYRIPYIEYHSVCPIVGIDPLPRKPVPNRGKTHSLEGGGSQFSTMYAIIYDKYALLFRRATDLPYAYVALS